MITEGALLFVAAQTGFIDGPRVLATMAHDRWLPRRFSYLSTRLVTQDGVMAMGLAAARGSHRHRRQRRSAGGPVRHQCLRDLHPVAARNEHALVERAQNRTRMGAQAPHQRHRMRLHAFDSAHHARLEVQPGRMGHHRDHQRAGRPMLRRARPLRACRARDEKTRSRHSAQALHRESGRAGPARSRCSYRGHPGQRFQWPRPRDAAANRGAISQAVPQHGIRRRQRS